MSKRSETPSISTTVPSESDVDLVGRVATGDARAIGVLYDRHGYVAYSLARAIVRDAADAEEVVADAFVRVWRSAAEFDPTRGSVGAWLFTIVRTRALDLLRVRKRRAAAMERAASLSDDGDIPGASQWESSPDRYALAGDERARVRRALGELPVAQRRVLELAYFGGFSQSEIATALAEPLGTVKTRMRDGMTRLRAMLTPEPEHET